MPEIFVPAIAFVMNGSGCRGRVISGESVNEFKNNSGPLSQG